MSNLCKSQVLISAMLDLRWDSLIEGISKSWIFDTRSGVLDSNACQSTCSEKISEKVLFTTVTINSVVNYQWNYFFTLLIHEMVLNLIICFGH